MSFFSQEVSTKWRDLFPYFGILFIGILAYFNVLHGPFLFDDIVLVELNETITSFGNFKEWFSSPVFQDGGKATSNLYRPISTFFNALIYHFFSLNPVSYHLSNVLLHILNGCLIFSFFKKLRFIQILAFVFSIIFVIHPLQTESVSYIAGLPDVLSAFFVLLAVNLYMHVGVKLTKKRIALLVGVFILALLSKEGAIVLPALLVLVTVFQWKDGSKDNNRLRLFCISIIFLIAFGYLILKFSVLNFTGTASLLTTTSEYTESLVIRLMTFVSIIWDYFVLIFFPRHLHFDKSYIYYSSLLTLRGLFGISILVFGLIGSWLSLKKNKIFFVGFLWFFFALAPVSGLTPPNTPYAAHWLYIPLIGVFIMMYGLVEFLYERYKYVCLLFFVIICILLSLRTFQRNVEFADPIRFYTNELHYTIDSPRLYVKAGGAFAKIGEYEKAIRLYDLGIQVDFNSSYPDLWYGIGTAYVELELFNEAAFALVEALKVNPNMLMAHDLLQQIFFQAGQYERAAVFEEFISRIETGGVVTHEEILGF